jgi:hypothetical protein
MKQIIKKSLLALTATTLVSTSAIAKDIGVGVGVTSNTTVIRADIELQDNLRLEPFLGFSYADNDNGSTSNLELGTALHITDNISPSINTYYGGYAGITFYDTPNASSSTSFTLGPVAGVEYAFEPKFTLGAEVSVGLALGDTTAITTNSAVILRYYFD